jgi:7-keto-8-aminopelargonate synthetase-like enzyme
VRHLKSDPLLRGVHQERAATLKRRLARAALPMMPSASHIVLVVIDSAVDRKLAADELLHCYSVYVQPINYPTVSRHRAASPYTKPRCTATLISISLYARYAKFGTDAN